MQSLEAFRQFYASYVAASVGVREPRIVKAFAEVRREDFLPRGPWQVLVPDGYVATPNADPALLYQDIVVAIDASRRINNGEPSLHARCLAAVAPEPGETILHVGCGSGYYTAILAALTGPRGRVTGLEVVAELAELAQRNLAHLPTVAVECRSGAMAPLPMSDVIYVNAGATEPLRAWLDALRPGGRLIFPLTPGWDYGGMLLVTNRHGSGVFEANFVTQAGFIPCLGAQDEQLRPRLKEAFALSDWKNVRSLWLADGEPDSSCWFAGQDWWLSTATVH